MQQRVQLVEQIKSVENVKDRATTSSAAAGTVGKYLNRPSDTSVPFVFARNHATQSSLLPCNHATQSSLLSGPLSQLHL
jgi:hypothetical protein